MRIALATTRTMIATLLLAGTAWAQSNSAGLERVLAQMDRKKKN